MSSQVYEWLLKLVELRRDRSVARSRRAQQDYLRSKQFSDELKGYSHEYDQQWQRTAAKGDSVLLLQTTASFGGHLHNTSQTQQQETKKLQGSSEQALQQALQDSRRAEALRNFMDRQKVQRRLAAERREQKALEDDLNARPPRR
jgi:flagellar export protein FliJ